MEIELQQFGPGEAAEIAGADYIVQREWRKRGFVVAGKGGKHARLTVYDIAALRVFTMLGERGIGPSRATPIADFCVAGIAYGAFLHRASISGDTSGFGKSKEAVARAILQRTVPEKYDNGEPQRFLMSWSDGTTMSSDKVDDIIRRIQKTPEVLDRLASATVLIDLYTTGLKLVTNTMRPFVRVRRVDNRPARRREIRPEA